MTKELEGDPRVKLLEYAMNHKVDAIFTGSRGFRPIMGYEVAVGGAL